LEKLFDLAVKAKENAYVPYSHFPIGAALETEDGEIYTGCNIENASYGLTVCGERTAIFKSVSEGHKEIKRLAVASDTEEFCYPCGACRQVMAEWGDFEIYLINKKGDILKTSVKELLPNAFTESSLNDV
jgi:cytidine deaminase